MRIIHRLMATASLSVLAVGGVGLFAANPAWATSGMSSTLECTPGTSGSGQNTMSCTATAPAGVRSIRVTDTTFAHSFAASSTLDCSSGATSNTIRFPTFFNDRYKVIVTDCQNPAAKDIYRVGPDGTVTLIRSSGGAAG